MPSQQREGVTTHAGQADNLGKYCGMMAVISAAVLVMLFSA